MNDIDHIENDDARMSRPGVNASGGCTETTKFLLPLDLDLELRRTAARAGTNVSEYVRDLVCFHLREQTFGELVAESRRAILQGEGQKKTISVDELMRRRAAK